MPTTMPTAEGSVAFDEMDGEVDNTATGMS